MLKIYTFADKRPDFIQKQKMLFEKFVEDEYEFIIVNSASNLSLKKQIFLECEKLHLKCLDYPEINTYPPQPACSMPIQWCWDNFIADDKSNLNMIIDSDMFIINKFNVHEYSKKYDICADYDKRAHVNYLWNGLMIFTENLKERKKLNFSEGVVDGVITDVGGNLYHYLNEFNPLVKHIENVGYICTKNENTSFLPKEMLAMYDDSYLCEFFEQTFFHYRAGSNWNNKSLDYHMNKTNFLDTLIQKAMNDELTIPQVCDYRFHELDSWWDIEWPTHSLTEYSRYINGRWVNA